MVEYKLGENVVIDEIVEKYLRNKHVLLVYLGRKEEIERPQTVVDVVIAFKIKKKYAWTLLEKLEEEDLIKKDEKVEIKGKKYNSYILTEKAKHELKILSLFLSRYRTLIKAQNLQKNSK